MGLYDTFGNNETLEVEEGVTIPLDDCGASFQIRRAGGANKKFDTLRNKKFKPYLRQITAGTLPIETATKLLAELYAEAVLIGWKGVTGRDGKDLPFTKENATKLLLDLPDLFELIQTQAQNLALFKMQEEEEDKKN